MLANFNDEEKKVIKEILKNGIKFYDFLITNSKLMLEDGEILEDVIREIVDTDEEMELVEYLMKTDLIKKIKNL